MKSTIKEKLYETILNTRYSIKSEGKSQSNSNGFNNWKRPEGTKGVNEALGKLVINSVLHNLE
jgi:hypothetical protein